MQARRIINRRTLAAALAPLAIATMVVAPVAAQAAPNNSPSDPRAATQGSTIDIKQVYVRNLTNKEFKLVAVQGIVVQGPAVNSTLLPNQWQPFKIKPGAKAEAIYKNADGKQYRAQLDRPGTYVFDITPSNS